MLCITPFHVMFTVNTSNIVTLLIIHQMLTLDIPLTSSETSMQYVFTTLTACVHVSCNHSVDVHEGVVCGPMVRHDVLFSELPTLCLPSTVLPISRLCTTTLVCLISIYHQIDSHSSREANQSSSVARYGEND